MIKFKIIIISLAILITANLQSFIKTAQAAPAETSSVVTSPTESAQGATPPKETQKKFGDDSGSPDSLFHKFEYSKGASNETSKIAIVKNLPDGSMLDLITAAIKFMLTLSATLTVTSFTYGGVIMVVNQGNEDEVGKVKKLIYWNLIALGIIAAAYGIVLGIARLTFFQ